LKVWNVQSTGLNKVETIRSSFSTLLFLVVLAGGMWLSACDQHERDKPPKTMAEPAGKVVLRWDAPTQNVDGTQLSDLAGYKIQVGESEDSYGRILRVGKTKTYKVTGLKLGKRYYFRIAAYDRFGNQSEWSPVISRKIDADTS